ncbi:hypothetical protein [Kitasatospora acidiphila]|uniref:hypothetical protein n=1 Tax=Kitasatospora acidiphila TaxID=2567942 RepID=UPI003C752B08
MNTTALAALSGVTVVAIALALGYLARIRIPRPPVGVYTAGDVAVVCVGVVLAPLLDLALPTPVVVTVFGVVLGTAVQFTLAPVLGGRWAWLPAAAAVGTTLALHASPTGVLAATDALLLIAVVGVANLWVQSGMRAAHVAALAAVLAVYDLVATTLTSVTLRFAAEVQGQPFAPQLALTRGALPVSLGLGDLLLLVLFPLAAAKAYGRRAALLAAAVGLAVVSAVSALFATHVLTTGFPLLAALGPLIVAQQLYWRQRCGRERNWAEWRSGAREPAPPPVNPAEAALRATGAPGLPEDCWLAVRDDRVVGVGATPGRARRDARRLGRTPTAVRQR